MSVTVVSKQDAARRQSVDRTFLRARERQAEGAFAEAEDLYGRILAHFPDHAESLTLLASLSYQRGQEVQAEAYLDRAVAALQSIAAKVDEAPGAMAPLVNLLLARGRRSEAVELSYRLALPLNPVRADREVFARRRTTALLRGRPPIVVNTIPKSASESIWNRFAEGLGMGQAYLSIGLFPDCCLLPARVATFSNGGIVTKEHISPTPHNLSVLAANRIERLVLHVRDPRQAMLSWAHFVKDDVSMRLLAPIWRRIVPPAEIVNGDLRGVIDWSIERYLPLLAGFIEDWIAIAERDSDTLRVLVLDFETFVSAPETYEKRLLAFHGIADGDFDRAAADSASTVHLRRGETDEWRSVLSDEQRERAFAAIPEGLRKRFNWTV